MLAACVFIFLIPVSDYFDDYGVLFYGVHSLFACLLIVAVLFVSSSRTAMYVAIIEFSAILVDLCATIGYLTPYEYFYVNYITMINTLNLLEVIVLIKGAPWSGIYSGVQNYCRSIYYRGKSYYRISKHYFSTIKNTQRKETEAHR